MPARLPLLGVRVHLSGAIPEEALSDEASAIRNFVTKLAQAVFRAGATLIHGSHPTFIEPLATAAKPFVSSGGERDALTLVRAQKFAATETQLAEMESQREYAAVQVIPSPYNDPNESLVPMRDWMAERSDVVIAVGGRHGTTNMRSAGVPAELEEMLTRGKPGFVVAGFRGAILDYVNEQEELFSRLHNGLSKERNQAFAKNKDVESLVQTIMSQLKLLPLIRENTSRGRLFRILALDGGGLRGVFTAAVLAKWDDMLGAGGGNEIVKNFDLVAGTSTGSILAIGLGLGVSPKDLLGFYRKEGPKIFPKNRQLRHWIRSKHETGTLRDRLELVLGPRKLNESCCRLVIPTVRAIHGEAEAIVTPHSLDRMAFRDISAVEAALASSAAPTYFDEALVDDKIAVGTYLDGGIWANNPVLPAIAEAVRHLKTHIDRIDVLSIGTLGNEVDFSVSLGQGKAGWAPTSADLFFAAQEHAAATLADSFLSLARHLRVNQQTPSEIKVDDTEAIDDMALRGANVAKDSFVAVRSRFLDGFHVPDWRSEC
jgi:patatin-like phospholipase/acyl hydrolase